ncbi:TIGR04149 family rSAM-modified RiPP [Flavobacterium reichenbachii]|jgi:natural product precursor|nr:TIGR04149 family rSAM-modified RiPP [Flavobacterium reichenbachii]
MKNTKIKFEDFENEKLSTKQQKMLRGGDGEDPPTDPGKTGGGSGNG